MKSDRALIATGAVCGIIAAICCVTPLPAIMLGAAGLTAWLAKADYIFIPVFLISLCLVGFGLYRRRTAVQACRDPSSSHSGIKS
jgi:mercuric ion transport protein